MPASDSEWTYVHMGNPEHVLYREKWVKDDLPFDDIDFNSVLVQQQQKSAFQMVNFLKTVILAEDDEEDELNISMNQTQFGASRSHRKLFANNVWKDLELRNFLDQVDAQDVENTRDKTMLKNVDQSVYQSAPVDSGGNFIDFEDETELESLIINDRDDPPAFIVSDESGDTVMGGDLSQNHSAAAGNDPSTTPIMTRSKKRYFYQTPVTRQFR